MPREMLHDVVLHLHAWRPIPINFLFSRSAEKSRCKKLDSMTKSTGETDIDSNG
jgi:hypothetical protein